MGKSFRMPDLASTLRRAEILEDDLEITNGLYVNCQRRFEALNKERRFWVDWVAEPGIGISVRLYDNNYVIETWSAWVPDLSKSVIVDAIIARAKEELRR